MFTDEEAWNQSSIEDLWIFDKLILSKKLGYVCGPVGVDVPCPGEYVVRPITNIMGMGTGAEIVHLDQSTDFLPVGYFWCERFYGRHLSVDYYEGKQALCVEGMRKSNAPLYKWSKWQRTDDNVPYPSVMGKIFTYTNCEFIGNRLIEIHLRCNPDWIHGADTIYPVWDDEDITPPPGMVFVPDADYKRVGFFVPSFRR